jgi:plastocyanin
LSAFFRILIWSAVVWAGGVWSAVIWVGAGWQPQAMAQAMTTTVRGRVEVTGKEPARKTRHRDIPVTVVWLTPMTGAGVATPALPSAPSSAPSPTLTQNLQLIQKNKSFEPHTLVVPAGAVVEFPNHDPFFHNVFSLFEGKRFDLGLYEAGTSRKVHFDRAGISYIFCNIHPEMSAVVITVAAPFYAISTPDGQLTLAGVPYGRYMLHVWSEGMGPETEEPPTREITIAGNSSSLGTIRVPKANGQHMAHKNMYGRDYDEPTPNNSVYAPQR